MTQSERKASISLRVAATVYAVSLGVSVAICMGAFLRATLGVLS